MNARIWVHNRRVPMNNFDKKMPQRTAMRKGT
nr:MAG TPA: hypothetical protein [Caudoviricetes sp.]